MTCAEPKDEEIKVQAAASIHSDCFLFFMARFGMGFVGKVRWEKNYRGLIVLLLVLTGGGGTGTDEGRVGRWAKPTLTMRTTKLTAIRRCASFMAVGKEYGIRLTSQGIFHIQLQNCL